MNHINLLDHRDEGTNTAIQIAAIAYSKPISLNDLPQNAGI